MTLREALIEVPQTERGGELALRGLDFQACWALTVLLENLLRNVLCAVVFEHHDDVLVLDCDEDPKEVFFAQVKTSEKNWPWGRLLNPSKDNPISILAKLFSHKKNFLNYQIGFKFVTNASFSFNGSSRFSAAELLQKEKDAICKKVYAQIGVDISEDLSKLEFIRSDLSLEDHDVHLRGKICDFTEQYLNGSLDLNPMALARMLESECRKRSKLSSSGCVNYAQLIEKKGFSTNNIKNIIVKIADGRLSEPAWETVSTILDKELNKRPIEIVVLKSVYNRVVAKIKMNSCVENSFYNLVLLSIDKELFISDVKSCVANVLSNISLMKPVFSDALECADKECIVLYAGLKLLIGDGEV